MSRIILPLVAAAVFSVRPAIAEEAPSQRASPQFASSAPVDATRLTLSRAVMLALDRHPEVAATNSELSAREAARVQAGARPNPELSFLQEDTRREARTRTLQINQPIELGGKREARLNAADRALDMARLDREATRHAVRGAVVTAFFDLLAIQERERIATQSLGLAERSTQAASQRVKSGKVSPVEETKSRVAEAGIRIELMQVRGEEVSARLRLNRAVGQSLGPVLLDARLADIPALPDAQLVRLQLEAAPAVKSAESDIERRKALTAVENSRRSSDVVVSLGVKRDQQLGRNQAVIGVTIPLPFFDRNQGNLLEALRREDKARDELLIVKSQTESDAMQALERLSTARTESQLLADEVLPGAQSAFDAATKGFELGKFSFLEALDAQRTLLQARTQYLRALAETHKASADLNRILGIDTMSVTP